MFGGVNGKQEDTSKRPTTMDTVNEFLNPFGKQKSTSGIKLSTEFSKILNNIAGNRQIIMSLDLEFAESLATDGKTVIK